MPKGARRAQDARRKEVALEALFEFCLRTNRKRRPRRESPDFKVVDKVMTWWLGDEWRHSTLDQQERHLRSATQWANQRVKRTRHRLVDDDLLQSRLALLLQMTSNGAAHQQHVHQGVGSPLSAPGVHPHHGAAPLAVPHFRGSARDWAARLGISPTDRMAVLPGDHHTHSLKCGHTPVKVLSTEGTTSLGFVMSRANCCAASGHLLCDVHAGNHSKATGMHPYMDVPLMEYATVSHGDHIDFVIDGHLTHPTTERNCNGELKWEDCGELIELDQETIADMYDILV